MNYQNYVGVFDSGVGGISVLRDLVQELPQEHFLYFGDSANAPYGEKSVEKVRELAFAISDRMVQEGVKAIVIACNTATSAAVREIREKYPKMPVIGVEPAVKPAALAGDGTKKQKVLVMATPMTISLPKLQLLQESLQDSAEFLSLACTGLAARIEKGALDQPDLMDLLHHLLDEHVGKIDSVVLGCTHYPFIREQIRSVLGDIPMYDGGEGTARELHRELREMGLLCTDHSEVKSCEDCFDGQRIFAGNVVFESSLATREELELYRTFFEMK